MAGRTETLSLLAAGAMVGAAGALLFSRNSRSNDAKTAILLLVAGEEETRELVRFFAAAFEGACPHAKRPGPFGTTHAHALPPHS